MPSFGKVSRSRRDTCHHIWIELLNRAIEIYDFSVACGHRGEEDQNKAFRNKRSKLKWPNSKHNTYPSLAVDIVPYVNDEAKWEKEECCVLAGIIKTLAFQLNENPHLPDFELRWGGDWDGDNDLSDQSFYDWVHFEIKLLGE